MGFEFELKFRATPETLEKIRQQQQPEGVIRMETTYYDTAEGSLAAKKYTLRLRRENDICVCTMKTPAGKFGRGEFEVMQDKIESAIPELCKLSGVDLPTAGLVAVCGARFTRHTKVVVCPDCTVELALDEGVLTGGGRQQPLCEVEVELKEGIPEGAVAYARAFAQVYGLEREEKSKFKRALELSYGGL